MNVQTYDQELLRKGIRFVGTVGEMSDYMQRLIARQNGVIWLDDHRKE